MYTNIEERAIDLAVYIIENKATVRQAAKHFGISNSTVHTVHTIRNVFSGKSTKSTTLYRKVTENKFPLRVLI